MTTVLHKLDAEILTACADVRRELLDSRESIPKRAGNNHAPLPSNPTACRLHKSVVDDDAKFILSFMILLATNVDDRMPWSEVVRPLRRMEAFLGARCAAKHAAMTRQRRDLNRALHREQRANYVFDDHEMLVLADKKDPERTRAAINAGRDQIRYTEEAVEALEQHYVELTVERVQPAQVWGARPTTTPLTMVRS